VKRRKLVWTERAEADLAGIGEYIAADDPVAARRWVGELMATARAAARVPFGGRRVPELQREDVREVFLRQYRIVYRVTDRHCEVLTVFEGHKLLRDL
jgi:toxin ParE1/3/4